MRPRPLVAPLVALLAALSSAGAFGKEAGTAPRPLEIDDYFRLRSISDPRISPDGLWMAYTIGESDLEANESHSRIWTVPAEPGRTDREPIPELVVYPGEFHGISTLGFVEDRWQRYLDWFDRHVKSEARADGDAATTGR